MSKNSNYNNTKKTETKWGIKTQYTCSSKTVREVFCASDDFRQGHGYGLEVPCEYHFEGDNFRAIG